MRLPSHPADWPEDARSAYDERVAICVIDGALPEDQARRLAEARVRLEWARRAVPGDREEWP